MNISERTVYNRGREIEAIIFTPERPVCAIQLLHGMAEYKERYTEMMTWLAMNDCMVIIHDHRGHGRGARTLGHFDDFTLLIDDARAVSRLMPESLPKFILGHSMGSIVAGRLLEYGIYDGGIIVGTGNKETITDRVASKLLGKVADAAPKARSKAINRLAFLGYDASFEGTQKNRWLSADSAHVRQYNEDPYCGFLMSNRALSEILRHFRLSQKHGYLKKLSPGAPILLISGKEDPLSSKGLDVRKRARRYRRYVDSVTVQLYEDSRHEVLFEKNREQVYSRLLEWVMRHV